VSDRRAVIVLEYVIADDAPHNALPGALEVAVDLLKEHGLVNTEHVRGEHIHVAVDGIADEVLAVFEGET
jgi:hypothetical protein